MTAGKSTTVFGRLRAGARSGQPFVPTPVTTRLGSPTRIKKEELGVYATVEEFAALTGLDSSTIDELLAISALTCLRIANGTLHIHVEKGLRDLERMEIGPTAARSPPFSSINDDAA